MLNLIALTQVSVSPWQRKIIPHSLLDRRWKWIPSNSLPSQIFKSLFRNTLIWRKNGKWWLLHLSFSSAPVWFPFWEISFNENTLSAGFSTEITRCSVMEWQNALLVSGGTWGRTRCPSRSQLQGFITAVSRSWQGKPRHLPLQHFVPWFLCGKSQEIFLPHPSEV